MRRLFALLTLTAVLTIALPASAHNFTGDGNCEGWNLVLDGTWNAHTIYVDGVSVGLDLTVFIADSSTDTSRTFVVFWDKNRGDVTVTHKLYRNLENCTPTTTSTTQPETTTTTQPETTTTTTPNETTTTVFTEQTTTTIQECVPPLVHQPPFCVDPTTAPPTETTPAPTTPAGEEELPFTSGGETGMLALAALSLLALGGAMLKAGKA